MQLWTKTWDYRDEIQTHENICVSTYKWIFTSWMFSFDVYIWFPIIETSKHYRRNLFDIYFNENSAAKGGGVVVEKRLQSWELFGINQSDVNEMI